LSNMKKKKKNSHEYLMKIKIMFYKFFDRFLT